MLRPLSSIFWLKFRKFLSLYPTFTRIDKGVKPQFEMHKIISYVYSIPCSNAFVEAVFSHMKSAWTASRNSMVNETIAAELKIRLNSTMACEDFFSFAQTQPQLIKCAKSQQKYSFEKKRATFSVNINREGSL